MTNETFDPKAELSALKLELETLRAEMRATEARAEAAEEAAARASASEDAASAEQSLKDRVMGEFDGVRAAAAEFADFQRQRPLATTFGVFVLGYLIGRAR